MFSKTKKVAVLLASAILLSTTFSGTTVFADDTSNNSVNTTATTDTNTVSTATNNTDTGNSSVNDSNVSSDATTTTTSDTQQNNSAVTQAGIQNIDVSAVKSAMLAELNRLREQNGLSDLTSVDVLNTYAQQRTDSFVNSGVDNHAGWNSANMYPYNVDAEENIAQMPFSMLNTTDPTTIAQKLLMNSTVKIMILNLIMDTEKYVKPIHRLCWCRRNYC
jgi:hypothetical protein